jgi:hypothetical protein
MRCFVRCVVALACALPLAGCDALFAETKEIRYLCPEALLGLYIEQVGDEVKGELYLFDDAAKMPRASEMQEGESFGGVPLAAGVVDAETRTLVFPLRNNTLVQANSAKLLRKNGSEYVEFDLDFAPARIAGRWREGEDEPKFQRVFRKCGVPDPEGDR